MAGGIVIPRSAWLALYLTSVGQALVILQSSVVNIAFPSIEASFPATPRTTFAWVVTGLRDRIRGSAPAARAPGRHLTADGESSSSDWRCSRSRVSGKSSGLAPSPGWLIGWRVLQSFGGALMIPTSLSLVLPLFPATHRSVVGGLGVGRCHRRGGRSAVRGCDHRARGLALDIRGEHTHRAHDRGARSAPLVGEQGRACRGKDRSDRGTSGNASRSASSRWAMFQGGQWGWIDGRRSRALRSASCWRRWWCTARRAIPNRWSI